MVTKRVQPSVATGGSQPSSVLLAAKRAVDLAGALVLLLLLAPLLAGIALLIRVTEGRPILFRQTRVGHHGRPFTMYKFRTMVPDAHDRLSGLSHHNERLGPLFKSREDPRVTRCGKVLRLTSLDELPQLWNVVDGSMSLVGPRPALFEERAQFPAALLERETLPQGLTGRWQVDGRLDADFATYADLDLEYVRNWSLRGDLVLLLRTPPALIRHAFAPRSERRLRATDEVKDTVSSDAQVARLPERASSDSHPARVEVALSAAQLAER